MAVSTVASVTPVGLAYSITANATAVISWAGQSVSNLYVENLDATNDIFVNWTVGTGAVAAVLPTAGNPQSGICVQNGQGRIILIPGGTANTVANVAVTSFAGTPQAILTPVA